jgi:CRP-like cAMP-binding protein
LARHKLTEVRAAPTHCTACPIRQKALFQVVTEDYLQDAESRRTAQYRLPARSILYQEGAPAAMAYTLYDGWLLLFRTHSDGSRQGLRVALPGDFVGYAPLAEADHSHGAVAVSDVVVCGFRQHDLHAMLDKHRDIARKVMSMQARDMANCETNLLGLGRKSAEQRIAYTIVDLYHRLDQRDAVDSATHSMPFPLTQEMLGELTGLTPVHTNRVLRRLRSDGVLACTRHRLEILDLPRLAELADYRAGEGM